MSTKTTTCQCWANGTRICYVHDFDDEPAPSCEWCGDPVRDEHGDPSEDATVCGERCARRLREYLGEDDPAPPDVTDFRFATSSADFVTVQP